MALRTTCIKNVKFKFIKIRTGCQYVGYVYYIENLTGPHKTFDWATCGSRVGHSWDRQSQTRRRGCHCCELQDDLFAFCGRIGTAGVDLHNRVFSTHLIGFLLRATKQERKSPLKGLRHCVSQDDQGIVFCKCAAIHCSR